MAEYEPQTLPCLINISDWEKLELSLTKGTLYYIKNCNTVSWDFMTQSKDGTYTKSAINSRISELQREHKFPEESFEDKMMAVLSLIEEESQIKREVKQKSAALHLKTKEAIEELDEDTTLRLLELKWIKPLVDAIFAIPDEIIAGLTKKIIYLSEKYQITFEDVEKDIEKTGVELSKMIDELVGSEADMEGLAEFKKLLGV